MNASKSIFISSISGLSVSIGGECAAVHEWKSPKVYQLLTTLIAFGGRNVPIGSIYDAIWADMDGDKAMQNLEFILRRLRQTLFEKAPTKHKDSKADFKKVIQLQHGKLSFHEHYCELDIWQWENLTEQARAFRQTNRIAQAIQAEQQAANLLTGKFLAGDEEITYSQQLIWNTRFCNWIDSVCTHWRADSTLAHHDIIALLDTGLIIAPCSESLCLQRMNVLVEHGYRVDAMQAFKTWESLIQKMYNIHPSGKTAKRFQTILASL